jgi:23S rRNA pseudouridine2605 synthase
MENNQEEPNVYRPRTGSMERRKTATAATDGAELPTGGDEPKPRPRKSAEEQPASRVAARQSFFKNRTPQGEAYANDDEFNPKPRRASRSASRGDDDTPRRRSASRGNDDTPRRRSTSRGGDDTPRRRSAGRGDGERAQKSSGFEGFYREKPRGDRRTSDRDRRGAGGAYARKPYPEEEPRSYRAKRAYDERDEKPRREKPLGDRRRYDSDRNEKPYARKPYGEKESYGYRTAKPRAERKPVREIQVKEPNMPVRLNKFIANSGVCSRREADEYIQNGEITVNGEVVTTLGTKVLATDEICWNGEKLSGEKKVYILLNKPKGYVTTVEDPHADKTVMTLIADACSERVYPVGRLDKNTTGVLLFTNDGELTKTLTHPSYNKRKVYQVTLNKTLKKPDMEQLVEGVELEDGVAVADEVGYTNLEDKSEVGLEIHSGRNRVVRRMFEALGYEVKKLDRVYFAGLTKKSLERGKWRTLSPKEVSILKMGAYE